MIITAKKFVMKYKSKYPLFNEFNFLKEYIYVNKATSVTFDNVY